MPRYPARDRSNALSAGMAGDRQGMLVSVERKGTNLITLHPTPEWLTMLQHADVDLLAYDRAPCSEAAGPLAEAVRRIENDPGTYRLPRPDGHRHDTGFDVLELLRWAAEKCARRPEATLRVQIRNA